MDRKKWLRHNCTEWVSRTSFGLHLNAAKFSSKPKKSCAPRVCRVNWMPTKMCMHIILVGSCRHRHHTSLCSRQLNKYPTHSLRLCNSNWRHRRGGHRNGQHKSSRKRSFASLCILPSTDKQHPEPSPHSVWENFLVECQLVRRVTEWVFVCRVNKRQTQFVSVQFYWSFVWTPVSSDAKLKS